MIHRRHVRRKKPPRHMYMLFAHATCRKMGVDTSFGRTGTKNSTFNRIVEWCICAQLPRSSGQQTMVRIFDFGPGVHQQARATFMAIQVARTTYDVGPHSSQLQDELGNVKGQQETLQSNILFDSDFKNICDKIFSQKFNFWVYHISIFSIVNCISNNF